MVLTQYVAGAPKHDTRRDNGEEIFSLKLDFPVAVEELVMFKPSYKDAPQD